MTGGLQNIATRYGRSPAQLLIRWGLQKGFVTIPKSSRIARIEENASVFDFEITGDDIVLMDGLNEGYSCTWNPADAP